MRPISLLEVFRPIYRRFASRERAEFSAGIQAARPPKAGGAPGGRLVAAVLKCKTTIKVWGYNIRYSTLGPLLRLFTKGKHDQAARPVDVETPVDELAAELEAAAGGAFEQYDAAAA